MLLNLHTLGNRGDYQATRGLSPARPPGLCEHLPPAARRLRQAAKSHSGSRSLTSDPGQDLARLPVRGGHATLPSSPRPPGRDAAALGLRTAPLARPGRDARPMAPRSKPHARPHAPSRACRSSTEGLLRFWRLGIQDQGAGQFGFWYELEMAPTGKRSNTWGTKDK
ncbi:unnamed protein product [Nyctereutes procyonoides]|uniref:(raccoon dog) hypothetical protein n=1 Tax=Nyctereutes procyonoides TaxID=34880 RepID=A0A811Y135_NYCPR|nr:unnamed protein product [Nyctereutes procyonoides]